MSAHERFCVLRAVRRHIVPATADPYTFVKSRNMDCVGRGVALSQLPPSLPLNYGHGVKISLPKVPYRTELS